MGSAEWQKVFKAAVNKAKELRKKNPNLTYPQAMKAAWKTPEILKLKDDYKKKHSSDDTKKKGGAKTRGRPKGSTTRKSTTRKTATRKTATRKTATRKTATRKKVTKRTSTK